VQVLNNAYSTFFLFSHGMDYNFVTYPSFCECRKRCTGKGRAHFYFKVFFFSFLFSSFIDMKISHVVIDLLWIYFNSSNYFNDWSCPSNWRYIHLYVIFFSAKSHVCHNLRDSPNFPTNVLEHDTSTSYLIHKLHDQEMESSFINMDLNFRKFWNQYWRLENHLVLFWECGSHLLRISLVNF